MKTEIEFDRIRLTAENEDDNQAILAIMNLQCAAGGTSDAIANDSGCFPQEGDPPAFNWCCIPLEDVCEKLARRSGNLVDESEEHYGSN